MEFFFEPKSASCVYPPLYHFKKRSYYVNMRRTISASFKAIVALLFFSQSEIATTQTLTTKASTYRNEQITSSEEKYLWGDTILYVRYTPGLVQCIKLFDQGSATVLALFEYPTKKQELAHAPHFSSFRSPVAIHTCTKEDGYPTHLLHASQDVQQTGEVQLHRTGNRITTEGEKLNKRYDWTRDQLMEWTEKKSIGTSSTQEREWEEQATVTLTGQRALKKTTSSTTAYAVNDSKNFVKNYVLLQTLIEPVVPHFYLPENDYFQIIQSTIGTLTWQSTFDSENRITESRAEEILNEKKIVHKTVIAYF